jgi:hypothetical protein|uniref:DUF7253 domain-containing protein n=1 Tax=Siphoviridae sp. ctDS752 TaxID=2825386 RepID=A0A8S5U895_9CAUD|nr:MAG TPA: hypothetical protein [Siphoviridae sp. ctDS752]
MSKWFGKIGYAIQKESEPGIWEEEIIERDYYGDLLTDNRKRQSNNNVLDEITLSNMVSIIADPFAYNNCSCMAYAEIMGARWKISEVEVKPPRLNLTIGGVYNGNTPRTSDET